MHPDYGLTLLSIVTTVLTPAISEPTFKAMFYDVASTYYVNLSNQNIQSGSYDECRTKLSNMLLFDDGFEFSDLVYFLDALPAQYNKTSAWIGGRTMPLTNKWRWDNEDVDYEQKWWCNGVPKLSTSSFMSGYSAQENCAVLKYEKSNWCVQADDCFSQNTFICEKKLFDYVHMSPEYDFA